MPLDISAEEFQHLAERIARLASDYLLRLEDSPIQPAVTGARLVETLGGDAPERGRGAGVVDLLRSVVDGSRVQNGRFFGYVLGSGEPAGAPADLLASVLNQNLTAWRSAPAGVTVERTVVRWLAEAIGCGGFSGSLTGGGSSANLMGLAMAREAKVPANERGGAAGACTPPSRCTCRSGRGSRCSDSAARTSASCPRTRTSGCAPTTWSERSRATAPPA